MQVRIFILLIVAVLIAAPEAYAQELKVSDVLTKGSNIVVSSRLTLDKVRTEEIKHGVSKEIIFYLDLFRQWERWPDEFITGKAISQTIQCDPVKKENLLITELGGSITRKRFTECDQLLDAALEVKDLGLSKTRELEPASYYVRVSVESRLMRLPPFIDLLFFFVKETEFEVSAESIPFELKAGNETPK